MDQDITAQFVNSILKPGGDLPLIEQTALNGDLQLLRDAAALLIAAGAPTELSYAGTIIRVLAITPDAEAIEHAAQLLVEENNDGRLLSTVAMLACCQSADHLRQFLLKHLMDSKYVELMALLVQELVLRSKASIIKEPAERLWRQLREKQHPLAWLPIDLSPIEGNIALGEYRTLQQIAAGRRLLERLRQGADSPVFESEEECDKEAETTPTDDAVQKNKPKANSSGVFESLSEILPAPARLASCVESWQDSKSKSEARMFDFYPASIDFESALRRLPLECLRNFFGEPKFSETDVSDVFSILFSAASGGDAYSSRREGAYGRLNAWQSMATCAGSAPRGIIRTVLHKGCAITLVRPRDRSLSVITTG
jgi:hypothetical protein